MSSTQAEPVAQTDDTAGEEGGPNERAARLILITVALLAVWGIVAAFPDIAYVVVGILLTRGWDKARAWRAGRQAAAEDEAEQEAAQPDVGEALRRLVGEDNGVLLTRLRDDLALPDTKIVKKLLDADGITWKGVRTSHGNGPGVHVKDIPAAPSPVAADPHGEGCCCRSDDNGNGNNGDPQDPGEGMRVERIGAEGFIVYDPNDRQRHHQTKTG
ncbi:hypothetical protein ABT298_21435 [Streptomyces sp. NPDC001034]|uniref:hypothetical protein n=1 Tax=Streptomyces sp. NPDC001034 TaxID=3154375 RepID=UPI003327E840